MFVDVIYIGIIDWALKPPGSSDGWTKEHPKPNPEVGRAILIC